MDNRIYYGDYSLKHWLDLMLSGNVVLPEYQRSFVWKERDMRRLVKSLSERQFVQPITLALYATKANNINRNLIIDGQQRLTTILIAYIGYAPYLEMFEQEDEVASGDDSLEDDAADAPIGRIPVKWTFRKMLSADASENIRDVIRKRLDANEKYYKIEFPEITPDFFNKTFLGFSYIIPGNTDEAVIQNDYTKLFRNINYFGSRLSTMESRRSLYYMKSQYQRYFEGILEDGSDVLGGIRLVEKLKLTRIDFVRYLSTLSQYTIPQFSDAVLKWYSAYASRESFYADYVSYIVGVEQESYEHKFNGFDFNKTFPGDCWKQRFVILRDTINELRPHLHLNKDDAFTSWVDADYWLFGLIYHIVFEGKVLKDDYKLMIDQIKRHIKTKKDDEYYSKTPNRLGNLRDRLQTSVKVIGRYVQ